MGKYIPLRRQNFQLNWKCWYGLKELQTNVTNASLFNNIFQLKTIIFITFVFIRKQTFAVQQNIFLLQSGRTHDTLVIAKQLFLQTYSLFLKFQGIVQ